MKRRQFVAMSLSSMAVASCTPTPDSLLEPESESGKKKPLKIWWEGGFYPEEDNTLNQIITQWEEDTDTPVELTIKSQKDIVPDLESAIASNTTPDILYAFTGDLSIFPKLAWDNMLVDVSEIVSPQKNRYSENALAGVRYQNKAAGERSYYAVPLMQSVMHIHYWEDLLINLIGERRETIPQDWQGFWQFWLDIQLALEKTEVRELHSLGLPMSLCLDTYNNFEQFLEAYNVSVLTDFGQLNLEQPEVRRRLIQALAEYTRFYQQGAVPVEAVDWDNTGNNVSLLSRNSLMTMNHTLSVPGSQRSDEEIYYDRLSTVEWPNKPNGQPMRNTIQIKQAVVFAAAANKSAALSFLAYLSQPDNLSTYTKGSQGRYLPIMPELLSDPFWNDPRDEHLSVSVKELERTRTAYQTLNPAYGEVTAQNIWGMAIRKILVENTSVEQAADEAISEIQGIFEAWI